MLTIDNVYKVYGRAPRAAIERLEHGTSRDAVHASSGNIVALAGVTLEVHRGEVLVVMGLSGAGKSTLLRCLNALVRPDRGHVRFEDGDRTVDLVSAGPEVLREIRLRRISMVFQRHSLLPWRTVAGNVALGLELRGLDRREIDAIVDEKLAKVGLTTWKRKFPAELSGGMQQRVGLARALATDADVLLLDEPFSSLDPLIRARMQDEILALQRELRKTMIFVSHDLDEALKLGTRIAIMKGGRVVQVGTPVEIISNPIDEYVAEFVSHVNPVNVLRAGSLMRPVARLARDPMDPSVVLLDGDGHHRCKLRDDGAPDSVVVAGRPGRLLPYDDKLALGELPLDVLVSGADDISMKAVVAVGRAIGRPMVILDAAGKLGGVIGDRELLSGMLGVHRGVT